ncbi:MAG: chromosome partitioning protein ParA [Coriobacteriia bacterium]|nr:chromosome partitioning protein ParA [Coriobacteriia bacterium]
MQTVALCADEISISHPRVLGLAGENLAAQPWLATFSQADQARKALATNANIEEVWVASSDQMDAINLAAALKQDRPTRKVMLVAHDASGSLQSRAVHAGLDSVLCEKDFLQRYVRRKEAATVGAALGASPAVSPVTGAADAAASGANSSAAWVMPQGVNQTQLAAPDVQAATVVSGNQGFLLPVVSGSGGAGKSTISCLLALLAQQGGLNTVLLDLDLQFGDCRELLAYTEAVRIDQLVEAPERVQQARPEAGRVALIAPPEHLEKAELLSAHLPDVLNLLRSSFDLVVVNTGSFWTDAQVTLLERCSRALFLVDQRPSSLRGCLKALDLCTRCGIAASPFVFAVNRCSKQALYSSIDISCALHGAQVVEIRDGGRDVEDLMAASQPEDIISSHNAVVDSLVRVLGQLVPAAKEAGIGQEADGSKQGLFSSLRRK